MSAYKFMDLFVDTPFCLFIIAFMKEDTEINVINQNWTCKQ